MNKDELNHALKEKQLTLHFQPKLSLQSNRLCGAEALLRWDHPQQGLIYPDQFIAIALETGLMREINAWLLDAASTYCAQWHNVGLKNLSISINFSATDFENQDLPIKIQKTLADKKLPPHALELEMVESECFDNHQIIATVLTQLKTIGVKIAIDDFGAGYSSLVNIVRFPVDTIKIDQSLVEKISQEEPYQIIVNSVIQLSHRLNIQVLAEGVETQSQFELLRQYHCDFIQGKWLSPALENSKFLEFASNYVTHQ